MELIKGIVRISFKGRLNITVAMNKYIVYGTNEKVFDQPPLH